MGVQNLPSLLSSHFLNDPMLRKTNQGYASVSEVASYAYCPRLCYFRQKFGEKPGKLNAAKEIYLSLRKGLDLEWARNRFLSFGGDAEIFDDVKAKLSSGVLDLVANLKPIDWEISLYSKKYRLKGVIDEIVYDSGLKPIVISLRAPKEGVWFRDSIKIASQVMLLNDSDFAREIAKGEIRSGFVCYCLDRVLKKVEVNRKLKFHVIKLVERVLRLRKGFIPERIVGKRCLNCAYRDSCDSTKSTFASRFL